MTINKNDWKVINGKQIMFDKLKGPTGLVFNTGAHPAPFEGLDGADIAAALPPVAGRMTHPGACLAPFAELTGKDIATALRTDSNQESVQ